MTWDMNLWAETVSEAVKSFASKAATALPAIIEALVVFLLGFICAGLSAAITRKILSWLRLDSLVEKTALPRVVEAMGYKKGVIGLVARLVYWAVFLVFLSASASIIGLEQVADVIRAIFSYIPSVIAALIIIIIGVYVAKLLRDSIIALFRGADVPYAPYVAGGAQVLVYAFVIVLALQQLGLDTTILMSNISIIIAGVMLAFAISFGLGSREVMDNIVRMHYLRDVISIGDTIDIDEISGKVAKITRTGVIIQTDDGTMHFISAQILSEYFSFRQ